MKALSKIKWIISVLLVFFIVLITNLIDREHYHELNNAVTTIYEDRVVASDLLFEISKILHKKEIAYLTNNATFFEQFNDEYNIKIDQFLVQYNQTKLTREESFILNQLQDELKQLAKLEELKTGQSEIIISLSKIDELLHSLSKIQLQEGKNQVHLSNDAIDSINLFTQIEIISLVIMAILIQLIIFLQPKVKKS